MSVSKTTSKKDFFQKSLKHLLDTKCKIPSAVSKIKACKPKEYPYNWQLLFSVLNALFSHP